MNFTDNYIKMCERNPDVQEEWEPEEGDWFAWKISRCYDDWGGRPKWTTDEKYSQSIIGSMDSSRYFSQYSYADDTLERESYFSESSQGTTEFKAIWLPLQHQLQGLLVGGASPGLTMKMLIEICGWDGKTYSGKWLEFKTLEELWLAFVMKEKWNKVWRGGEWVEG